MPEFRGKSLRTVINSAFPQAPLRTQCRLRKRREGREASAPGSRGLRGDRRPPAARTRDASAMSGTLRISGPAQGPSVTLPPQPPDQAGQGGDQPRPLLRLKATGTKLRGSGCPVSVLGGPSSPACPGPAAGRSEGAGAPALPQTPGAGSEDSGVWGACTGGSSVHNICKAVSTPLT